MEGTYDAVQLTRQIWVQSNADEVKKWPVVLHPALLVSLVGLYVATLTLGPKMMANRKPFDLRRPIMAYNCFQLVSNFLFVYMYFSVQGLDAFTTFSNICSPALRNDPRNYGHVKIYNFGIIMYYVLKMIDLTETVFFVLRKKQSQISALHVYHHLTMLISSYVCIYTAMEEISLFMGFLNTSVHLVMYVYYFLAGFGPQMQKYLWWKRYITLIQMAQFAVMLSSLFKMAFDGCQVSPVFWCIWVFNVTSFLVMFYKFYSKAYRKDV